MMVKRQILGDTVRAGEDRDRHRDAGGRSRRPEAAGPSNGLKLAGHVRNACSIVLFRGESF
jgi:hypothetical protein